MQSKVIKTHKEDALDRVIGQYKNKDKICGIITVLCKQIQDLEDSEASLLGKIDIDKAEDTLLENIGKIVGQERLGFSNEIYRILLYTRIAINISGGVPENLISIFRIITRSETVDFREIFPASVQIMGDREIPESLIIAVKNAVRNALPAGVELIAMGYYDKDRAFEFEDGYVKADNQHGFGDTDNIELGGMLSVLV